MQARAGRRGRGPGPSGCSPCWPSSWEQRWRSVAEAGVRLAGPVRRGSARARAAVPRRGRCPSP
eukprot:4084714-Pyramimonas_sp.AAC.1